MKKTIFLVKFNKGYYAKKQPHYDWSFTDDPMLAQQYITEKTAKERVKWGNEVQQGGGKAVVEKWELTLSKV